MSFLAPWFFVAGVAAISLPILFHLFRRTPRGRLPFSTLMFLTPSPPRLTSRSRLENWPLLLLRAAVLILLAAAFGRPLWRQLVESQQDVPAGVRTVLLVDTSASMRRGDLWARAQAEAAEVIRSAGPQDELCLMTFDLTTRKPLSFEAWRHAPHGERNALAQGALGELSAGWSATQLDQALIAAADELEAAEIVDRTNTQLPPVATSPSSPAARSGGVVGRKLIVLISDLQTGSRTAGLQRFEWPKGIEVKVTSIAASSANAGLHALETDDVAAAAEGSAEHVRVLVSNAADSTRESFELAWQQLDARAKPPRPDAAAVTMYVPPGQTRVVSAPALPGAAAAELVLRGDEEAFDNSLFIVPPAKERVRVLHLADEKADDPQSLRYFLERAFADSTSGRAVVVEAIAPHAPSIRAPTAHDLDDVVLVVVAVDRVLPAAWNTALGAWVERGGVALGVLQNAEAVAWRELLPERLREPRHITVAESDRVRDYALLGAIDLKHPLFVPLADPRFSDFTKIRVWRHRRLTLDEEAAKELRVPARFDTGDASAAGAAAGVGDPAVLELSRGAGRCVLLTFGWQPRESQLGVSSKFVPLMATLVGLGRRSAPPATRHDAGTIVDLAELDAAPSATISSATASSSDVASLAPARSAGPWTIKTPAGKEIVVAASAPRFALAEGPGIYEVRSSVGLRRIAVNTAADESKTAPLGPEALEALGVRLTKDSPNVTPEIVAERRTLQLQEMESRQQLWRVCLAAALALLIAETWYAGRVAHRESVAQRIRI